MLTKTDMVILTMSLISTLKVEPAPAGVVYSAMQAHGCSLTVFSALITRLESQRVLTLKGNILALTRRGLEIADAIDAGIARTESNIGARA